MNESIVVAQRSAKVAQAIACALAIFALAPLLCASLYAQGNDQDAAATGSASEAQSSATSPSVGPSIAPPDSPADALELHGAILKTIDATTLAAQVAGPIKELLVKEGDIVTCGQSLGSIHDEALRLELEQTEQ